MGVLGYAFLAITFEDGVVGNGIGGVVFAGHGSRNYGQRMLKVAALGVTSRSTRS